MSGLLLIYRAGIAVLGAAHLGRLFVISIHKQLQLIASVVVPDLMAEVMANDGASRCKGRPRDVTHALRMCARFATGPNASLAHPHALRRHLSIERRPLMVIDAKDVSPMPLHLTLGVTVALLVLAAEAVTCFGGEAAALTFCTSMGEILRHGAGVSPAPYSGGTFERRECHRVCCKMALIADLMNSTTPGSGAAAWRGASSSWQGLLPTLNRADTKSDDDFSQFATDSATFVDGLKAGFSLCSVTPKVHALCFHAATFLRRFRSLSRYREQGLEAFHGRFNQDAARYPSAAFLGSCTEFVKSSAVGGAPVSAVHRHLPTRKPAAAGARVAKGAGDKCKRAYKEQAGLSTQSAAYRTKATTGMTPWVTGLTKAAATRISTHRTRLERAQSRALVARGRTTAADLAAVSGWGDDGMLSDSESAALMRLLGWGLETDECE